MSHFTVLVIGDDPESQLAPFHEYESTGIDQYVQDVDITEEAREKYEKATDHQVVSPTGEALSYWDDLCYRDFTPEEEKEAGTHLGGCGCCKVGSYTSKDWNDGKGYRAKLHYVPEGYTEREVPMQELKSFETWVKDYYGYLAVFSRDELTDAHKYGYILIEDDKVTVIDRTNPNSKWDWYVLGGRWGDYFKLKHGGKSSSARKCDVDYAGMMKEKSDDASKRWKQVHEVIAGRPIPNWQKFREGFENIDDARDAWHIQEIIKDYQKLELYWVEIEEFDCTEEEYCQRAALGAVPTFALILDGKWYEKGDMGWWGVVKDEKDIENWAKQFNDLLAGLPDDTLLSVYDCHI